MLLKINDFISKYLYTNLYTTWLRGICQNRVVFSLLRRYVFLSQVAWLRQQAVTIVIHVCNI